MTIPQLAVMAKQKLAQLFGKSRADQIEREATEQYPQNGVKRAEAMASKAGIPVQASPAPTARQARPVAKPAPAANAGEVQALRQKVADLEKQLADVTAANEKQIAQQALEIACQQGNVPPLAFKASSNPGSPRDRERLWTEYHAMPVGEGRNDFYKRNRAAMSE